MPSYHDVKVFVNGKVYKITDSYAYQLTCTRAGGWNLWNVWNGKETLMGGEYNGDDFEIMVNGNVICKSDYKILGQLGSFVSRIRASLVGSFVSRIRASLAPFEKER